MRVAVSVELLAGAALAAAAPNSDMQAVLDKLAGMSPKPMGRAR